MARQIVNPPVERASTILFDCVADIRTEPAFGEYYYGLHGTATQWALAEALTELEPGAAGTALYCSGLAAITSPLLAVLTPGDELLVPDCVYGPTRRFCDGFLKRFGVATRYYDPLIGTEIREILSENTRAILLESPGSLTMEVQDVPGILRGRSRARRRHLARQHMGDSSPLPRDRRRGDVTVMAATKYVGGHADVMLGTASATPELFDKVQETSWRLGHGVSPDDACSLRGLRTIAVRMKQHEQSALKVAKWLKAHPQVGRVLHPALPDCPGHEFWKRDFKGSSGLFSFELKVADNKERATFIDRLELFGIGYSWGGYESLAMPIDPYRTVSEPPAPNLVRLHIGLEDPDDLIADLKSALERVSL